MVATRVTGDVAALLTFESYFLGDILSQHLAWG
jgi:hypothetical protein